MLLRTISLLLPRGPAEQVRFAAFMITATFMLLIAASYGVVASIFCRCVGYGGLSQWTTGRAFKWLMWWTTGVTFRVNDNGKSVGGRRGGEEALLERPAVFVGNHQS